MTEAKEKLTEVTGLLFKQGSISGEYRDLVMGVVKDLEAENEALKSRPLADTKKLEGFFPNGLEILFISSNSP